MPNFNRLMKASLAQVRSKNVRKFNKRELRLTAKTDGKRAPKSGPFHSLSDKSGCNQVGCGSMPPESGSSEGLSLVRLLPAFGMPEDFG